MVGKIFISYRRDDSKYQARMIHTALTQVIPRENVFMDIDSIPLGSDFRRVLKNWVSECEVLLALIGPGWINSTDPRTGQPSLMTDGDFVRIEIAEALARDVPVVPLLLDGAHMPRADQLPDDLKELVYRHAEFVDFMRFDDDVARLIRKLEVMPKSGAKVAGSSRSAHGPSAEGRNVTDEESAWTDAQAQRMIDGWQSFMEQWPISRHAPEAAHLISERQRNRQIRTFVGYKEGVTCARFSPDGRSILSNPGYASGEPYAMFDVQSSIKKRVFSNTDAFRGAVFEPGGPRLVAFGLTGKLTWWQTDTAARLFEQVSPVQEILDLAFVPHSPLLVLANGDGTIRLRDWISDKEIAVLKGHAGRAWKVTVSPDGCVAISGGDDGTLRVWDIRRMCSQRVLAADGERAHRGRSGGGAFSANGRRFYSAGDDGTIRTWDWVAGVQVRPPIEAHPGAASVAVTPNDRYLITGAGDDGDHLIKIWNASTGDEISRLSGHTGDVWPISISPDGRMMVSAGRDEFVRLWDISDLAGASR